MVIVIWVVFAIIVASFGSSRKIGFGIAFLVSLLLSPLIGLIVVLMSEKESETLMKLKINHETGGLTDEEFKKEVRKIVPTKEDKSNMNLGYLVVAGLIALVLLIYFLDN